MANHEENENKTAVRAIVALIVPFAVAYAVKMVAGQENNALFFGIIGMVSWLIGLRWYGIQGMGLRGGRALFAGAGFAVLGWIAFLIARIVFIPIDSLSTGIKDYIFLLLFEAFAVQLWLYGLFFRATAVWRGGLTAAISSGIVFGGIAFLFFQEFLLLVAYICRINLLLIYRIPMVLTIRYLLLLSIKIFFLHLGLLLGNLFRPYFVRSFLNHQVFFQLHQ